MEDLRSVPEVIQGVIALRLTERLKQTKGDRQELDVKVNLVVQELTMIQRRGARLCLEMILVLSMVDSSERET